MMFGVYHVEIIYIGLINAKVLTVANVATWELDDCLVAFFAASSIIAN